MILVVYLSIIVAGCGALRVVFFKIQDDGTGGRVRFAPETDGNSMTDSAEHTADTTAPDADSSVARRQGSEHRRKHGNDLRQRASVSTHAGVKQKHLRAVTVLGALPSSSFLLPALSSSCHFPPLATPAFLRTMSNPQHPSV